MRRSTLVVAALAAAGWSLAAPGVARAQRHGQHGQREQGAGRQSDEPPVFGPDGEMAPGSSRGDDAGDEAGSDRGAPDDEPGDEASGVDAAAMEKPHLAGDSVDQVAPDPDPDQAAVVGGTARATPSRLLSISGYIQPEFDFRYRPSAFPRDRVGYGFSATRTGVILTGEPLGHWSYTFHLVVSAGLLSTISDVGTVDRNGDGTPDGIDTTTQRSPGVFIERAVIDYRPIEPVRVRVGQMRIPFTIQNQSPNFALMFPDRAGPNQFFLSGTDLGGLVTYQHPYVQASVGVYNGTGADDTRVSTRGALYAMRIDVNPLGAFPFTEVLDRKSPLRVGLGAGLLYFPSKRYDTSGFEGINVRDLRASLSARVAVAGFYAQAELLRRQRTDNLSSRPVIATGGYAQASYYVPVAARFGVTPIARAGLTVEDQSFEPRTSVLTEGGVALHWHRGPDPDDAIKLIVQYFGEQRITEDENAYGATTQLQLQF